MLAVVSKRNSPRRRRAPWEVFPPRAIRRSTLMPGSPRIRLDRGVVLVMKGRMEEAEKEFEASSGTGSDGALGQIAWGLVLMQMNRMAEAIGVLRRLRDRNENDHLANWYLAEA